MCTAGHQRSMGGETWCFVEARFPSFGGKRGLESLVDFRSPTIKPSFALFPIFVLFYLLRGFVCLFFINFFDSIFKSILHLISSTEYSVRSSVRSSFSVYPFDLAVSPESNDHAHAGNVW